MKRIVFRRNILCVATSVVTISTALLTYACFSSYDGVSFFCPYVTTVIAANVALLAVLVIALYRNMRDLQRAQLIFESSLLHVKAAEGGEDVSWDIIFSPFGIMCGDRIVLFDACRCPLTALSFNKDKCIVTYGKSDARRTITLPKPILSQADLQEFSNKLQFETGVSLSIAE